MYSIANSTLALFYKQYRQIVEITMNRTDGTEHLTEADIIQGGMTVDRYCISGDKIEIGSAIAAELTLKLDNREGKFDDTNFEGAELSVRIGIKKWDAGRWENAKVEYVPIGYFTVDESPKKALSITLSALDRMVQFDKDFDADGITFPTTVGNLLTYCCTKCGVPLKTIPETLPNHSYQVKECPQRENLTYRQIIQWIGEITATCGYIDWDGKLRMEWYSDTDTVIDKSLRYTSDMNEKDVTITGVQVKDDEENIYLAGTDEYALNIEGNALIQYDHNVIAHAVFEKVNGFTYRPYTCTTKSLPHLYPMDKISYVDKNGVSHNSIVTHWVYKLNGRTHLTAKGVTATKENYAKANPLTAREAAVLAKMKKANEIELNSRQQAALALNETIVNSFGLFMSTVEEGNGSIVYYYHNAATLEDSSVIYTFREGGFAWTDDWNDGDPVWQYGMTKDGNALYKILSAYKIQAEFIDANAITSEKIAAGVITADKIKAGAIGGFTIDETYIGIGKTSYNDTENDGVYISTSGIGLGKGKFYVTDKGFFHAEEGEFVGNIKGGTININDNFIVDENGGVQLNGGITWGTGSSPTQVVYARSSIEKPDDNTAWSSFPPTSENSWHKTYSSYLDYYASYTYDGGKTWTDPIKIKGTDGDTKEIVYLYYRKTSSSAPSKPSYDGSSLPTGWSLTPTGVTSYYLYEFVSQCTVTNGTYGTWSTPVIWAKYGSNGSDATVTDQNVFNALTSNGTMYGCFTALNGKLYINAAYINAGTLSSDYTFTGKLVAENADIRGKIYATSGEIGNLTITGKLYFGGDAQYYIDANRDNNSWYIYLPNFRVGAAQAIFSGTLSGATGSFTGTVTASGGKIGNLDISDGCLVYGTVTDNVATGVKITTDSIWSKNGYFNNGCVGAWWISSSGFYGTWLEAITSDVPLKHTAYLTTEYAGYRLSGLSLVTCKWSTIVSTINAATSGSDMRIKKNIESYEDGYEVLFDNLKPCRYKYIDGTSDRYHTGFVAQEVVAALETAGLTTQDFAAVTLRDPGTDYECWHLRRDEFVALNTWQIQKLKQRVAELEAKLGG